MVSLGFGPTLFETEGYCLKAIPLGGSIKVLHTEIDIVTESESHTAIDQRSTTEQLAVTLSGCISLLLLAVALNGMDVLDAFIKFPSQILAGAASPTDIAQTLLQSTAFALQDPVFSDTLALVAAKFAALNLLPLPLINGGAAIALLAKRVGLSHWWPEAATHLLLLVWLGLLSSWFVAIFLYATAT